MTSPIITPTQVGEESERGISSVAESGGTGPAAPKSDSAEVH